MANAFATSFNTRSIPLQNEDFGVTVRLCRGVLTSAPFTARRIAPFGGTMGGELAAEIQMEMRAYLLPIDKCILDGDTTKPLPDDIVLEFEDEAGLEFETAERWRVHVPDSGTLAAQRSSTGSDWETQVFRAKGAL